MWLRITLLLAILLWLVGCAYRVEILQGSILTEEEISQLQIGMNKAQVEYILGTPSIIDSLNNNRWDYIFRSKKGRRTSMKKGYVIFDDDSLVEIRMEEFSQ